jgi:maltose O-acetyltransferase
LGLMRDRMLAGELYRFDDELAEASARARSLCHRFNTTDPADQEGGRAVLMELLGALGDGTEIRAPFHCDYGSQIHIGARSFLNVGAVILDVAHVSIGDDVKVGPYVQLLTATHPVDPAPRLDKWEFAEPIAILDNVWLGGGVIVCPGVTIGRNAVIGAGSVVTKDVPDDVVAFGQPARVVRGVS